MASNPALPAFTTVYHGSGSQQSPQYDGGIPLLDHAAIRGAGRVA